MEKPERKSLVPPSAQHRGNRRILLFVLCGVVMGVLFLLAGQAITQRSTANLSRVASAYTPETTIGSLTPPVPLPAAYRELVEEQVAQGLHLSVEQVRSQLHDTPGADLMVVAKPQGLSLDHVSALVLTALQTAGDQMLRAGTWTQRQADQDMQYWRQQSSGALIASATSWFLGE